MKKLIAQVLTLIAASVGTIAVIASPAYAEATGTTYNGGPLDVGIVTGVGSTYTSWTTLIGAGSGSVGMEATAEWYDIWNPLQYTQFGIATQCTSSIDSMSQIQWGTARDGLQWGIATGKGAGSADILAIGCGTGRTIAWMGLIRRTWFVSAGNTYEVLIGTGTRGACALPSTSGFPRFCLDSGGTANGAWLRSATGSTSGGTATLHMGVDLSSCDYGATGAAVFDGKAMAPALWTLDRTPNGTQVKYPGAQSAIGSGAQKFGVDSGRAIWPKSSGASAVETRLNGPDTQEWGGLWSHDASVAFDVTFGNGISTISTTAYPMESSGGVPSPVTANRGINTAGLYNWQTNGAGLNTSHHIEVWCLKNAAASSVITPLAFGTVLPSTASGFAGATGSCADISGKTLFDPAVGGGSGITWWAPLGCWKLVGDYAYFTGDPGIGSAVPDSSAPPAETSGCSLATALTCISQGLTDFVAGLADLPKSILEVLQHLFIPTTMTTQLLSDLAEQAKTKPPVSILYALVTLGANVVSAFTHTDSCASPTIDLGDYGHSYAVPGRCGSTPFGTAFNVGYTLVKAGMYGALLWALWAIGRDSMKS
jgi:hypothetical protein